MKEKEGEGNNVEDRIEMMERAKRNKRGHRGNGCESACCATSQGEVKEEPKEKAWVQVKSLGKEETKEFQNEGRRGEEQTSRSSFVTITLIVIRYFKRYLLHVQ